MDRAGRVKELVQESITRKMMLIDTSGKKVGQINGLSVMQLGSFSFWPTHANYRKCPNGIR